MIFTAVGLARAAYLVWKLLSSKEEGRRGIRRAAKSIPGVILSGSRRVELVAAPHGYPRSTAAAVRSALHSARGGRTSPRARP